MEYTAVVEYGEMGSMCPMHKLKRSVLLPFKKSSYMCVECAQSVLLVLNRTAQIIYEIETKSGLKLTKEQKERIRQEEQQKELLKREERLNQKEQTERLRAKKKSPKSLDNVRHKSENEFMKLLLVDGFKKFEPFPIPDVVRISDNKIFEVKFPIFSSRIKNNSELCSMIGQVLKYKQHFGDCGLILPIEIEDYIKNNVRFMSMINEHSIEIVFR